MLPALQFSGMGLPLPLLESLNDMGFKETTPIQTETIPAAMQGRDILGLAQTGTGKTGAFAVPLITYLMKNQDSQSLILAPTRELAAQIHKVLKQMCENTPIRGVLVVGGESFGLQQRVLGRKPHIIVATPGRLVDHFNRSRLELKSLSVLVLDEVDRMLEMGFAPQLKEIMKRVPAQRQTMLFSATLPEDLKGGVNQYLKNPLKVTIGQVGLAATSIKQRVIAATQAEKNGLLVEELKNIDGRVLIFTRTKHRADRLAASLHNSGHSVTRMHSGRSQQQRFRALAGFKSGSYRIMVATDIAGRGIDVDDIGAVINYDLAATRDDYVHRIGRTGRAGKSGEAISFVLPEEKQTIERHMSNKNTESSVREGIPPRRKFGHKPKAFGGGSGSGRSSGGRSSFRDRSDRSSRDGRFGQKRGERKRSY